jgi:uncharacterized membrane protein YqjE
MNDNTPNNDGNQPLGQSISDIVDRTTTIVHEEIELAKAELAVSLQNLLRGSVAGIVGGVFAFFGLFVLLIGLSFFIGDALGKWYPWLGFFIVAFFLFLFGALLAVFALKKIKKGSHLVPEQAISEAKATKAALAPEPPAQQFESVAVEETTVAGGSPAGVGPSEMPKPAPTAEPIVDPHDAEAAELLAAAKEAVDAPQAGADPPAPTFVTDRKDVPFGDDDKAAKAAAKAEAKAAKEAAKAQAKADKEAAKAQAAAEKQAAKEMKAAEKEAAKAKKEADKAIKKAGGSSQPTDTDSTDEKDGES